MPYTDAAKNIMLNALARGIAPDTDGINKVSLHTASPGSTGTNEVTGGSYARQTITWNAASAGAIDDSNAPVFDVPAGTTVAFVGFWYDSAGGNEAFAGYVDVADEVFTNAGTYTLTDADLDLNS